MGSVGGVFGWWLERIQIVTARLLDYSHMLML